MGTLLVLWSCLTKEAKTDSPAIQNGGEEEKQTTEELEKGMKALSTNDTSTPAAPPAKPQGGTPEGSPSKSPSKKKKKFKPPSFLKKSKKQKEKAET